MRICYRTMNTNFTFTVAVRTYYRKSHAEPPKKAKRTVDLDTNPNTNTNRKRSALSRIHSGILQSPSYSIFEIYLVFLHVEREVRVMKH